MSASQLIGFSNADPTGLAHTATRYLCPHGTLNSNSGANEFLSEMAVRAVGTYDRGAVYVTSNTGNGVMSFTLRVSRADTSVVVAVGAAQTGLFQDLTNSAAVVADDEIAWKVTGAGSSGTWNGKFVALRFAPTDPDETVTWAYTGGSGDALSTNSATRFYACASTIGNNANEPWAQAVIQHDGTARALVFQVDSNSRVTDSVMRSRVNGANGNQIITVGAAQTGLLEDVSNSDTLTAGAKYCYAITTSTGGGSIGTRWLQSIIVSADGAFSHLFGGTNASDFDTSGSPLDFYAGCTGNLKQAEATEAPAQVPTFAQTLSHLTVYVSSGSSSGASIRTRINGADGNGIVSIGASQTGFFEDLTNTDVVDLDDLIDVRVALVAGTNAITFRSGSLRGTTTTAVSGNRRRRFLMAAG